MPKVLAASARQVKGEGDDDDERHDEEDKSSQVYIYTYTPVQRTYEYIHIHPHTYIYLPSRVVHWGNGGMGEGDGRGSIFSARAVERSTVARWTRARADDCC